MLETTMSVGPTSRAFEVSGSRSSSGRCTRWCQRASSLPVEVHVLETYAHGLDLEVRLHLPEPLPVPFGPSLSLDGFEDNGVSFFSDEDLTSRKTEFLRQPNCLGTAVLEDLRPRSVLRCWRHVGRLLIDTYVY